MMVAVSKARARSFVQSPNNFAGEALRRPLCLLAPGRIQRRITMPLNAADCIPVSLTVSNEKNAG